MPKKRNQHGKDTEFYLGTIRQLKAENKALKKELKRFERREHFYDDKDLEKDETQEAIVVRKTKCPECNKGSLEYKNVVGRVFYTCDTCSYRSKIQKIADEET